MKIVKPEWNREPWLREESDGTKTVAVRASDIFKRTGRWPADQASV